MGKKIKTFPTVEAILEKARGVWKDHGKFTPVYLKDSHTSLYCAIFPKSSLLYEATGLRKYGAGRWQWVLNEIGLVATKSRVSRSQLFIGSSTSSMCLFSVWEVKQKDKE